MVIFKAGFNLHHKIAFRINSSQNSSIPPFLLYGFKSEPS
jgi:hypothetical protein